MIITKLVLALSWTEQLLYWLNQNTDDWMPRAMCVTGNPVVIGLHIISELMIGIAYFSIPLILWYIIRRRSEFFKEYKSVILLFALFIFLCGTTHLMGVVMFWYPAYWVDGGIKLLTGAVSLLTAVFLFKLVPRILQIPTYGEFMDAVERAKVAENRATHLEEKIEDWTDYVDRHIGDLRTEHKAISDDLKDKGVR